MRKTALLLLGILIIAQLLIPASMILKHERILRTGVLYRFKTRPVDPADPLQGRYVRLGFEHDYIPSTTGTNTVTPNRKEHVYVTLDSGADGFCELTGWSRTKPESGDYLKLKYWGFEYDWREENQALRCKGLRFDLPFNRFYMEESKAPRAEKMLPGFRGSLRQSPNTNLVTNCWVTVRVLNGEALIEDLLIDGTPIRELAGQPAK